MVNKGHAPLDIIGVALIGALLLGGCSSQPHSRPMLSYEQVETIVSKPYPKIATPIAQLEEDVAEFRTQLTSAFAYGVIDGRAASKISRKLAVADYFITTGWATMVEGDLSSSDKALESAKRAYDSALELLTAEAEKGAI